MANGEHLVLQVLAIKKQAPQRAASASAGTSVSGETEKWEKMEERRVPERGQMCKYVWFHTDLASG